MPDNTLLFLGLGLAAWMLMGNNEQENGEGNLVDASMLSQGTGATGKALYSIPVVNSDVPINSTERTNGANGVTPGFDFMAWLNNIGINPQPGAFDRPSGTVDAVNDDLPNNKIGPEPVVNIAPFVQTPQYIRTTGELAGTAVRQLGLTQGVDVLNNKINVELISIAQDESGTQMQGPFTFSEDVEIVTGGVNPGDPYFTRLDFLVAAKDQGYFGAPVSGPEASTRSNVFDIEANRLYQQSITEPITATGGIPLQVAQKPTFVLPDFDTGGTEF